MKRTVVLIACLLVSLIGVTAETSAQGVQTGTIRGTVVDQQGLPVPNVTVTLTSRVLQGQRTVTTAADGSYVFRQLPAGDYEVAFETTQFAPAKRTTAVLLGLTVAVTALDFISPVIGARRYGSSKWGVWGSVAGTLLGVFLFPPLGVIVGAFAGALAGELVRGRAVREASRAAWGTFVGTMLGLGAKLAVCAVIAWYVVREIVA